MNHDKLRRQAEATLSIAGSSAEYIMAGAVLELLDENAALLADTFTTFQDKNRNRCEGGFGHRVAYDEPYWPLQNWCLAIAGEAGELCNLVKKTLRGDFTVEERREEILAELADVMTYCDLAISSLGANTGDTVRAKFDVVSKRIGWKALGDAS